MVSTKTSTARKQARQQARRRAAVHASALPDGDREFMATLAKGLTVMRAFSGERPTMTLSETAAVADLTRATARRILRTLTALGYVAQNGRQFSLTPRVLELGFGYLSSQSWIDQALPLMKELSAPACRNPARRRSCRALTSSTLRAFRRAAS